MGNFNKKLVFTAMTLMVMVFLLTYFISWISSDLAQWLFVLIPGYAMLSALLYRMIMQSNKRSPQRFVAAFTGSIGIKMLVTMVIIGIYVYWVKTQNTLMALSTFVIYMVYNLLLIGALLQLIKAKK